MTAQKTVGVASVCHVYNQSPEGKNIFSNTEDYATFLSFLSEYLVPPDPEKSKKEFTVNGRKYKGIPHQPKNYTDTIKLLAYSLEPNRFDLLVEYSDKNTLQRFMRSLSTRYSIYHHKKHHSVGSIFKSSYKSKNIKDDTTLLNLTHGLHQNQRLSTYQEYVGMRITPWVSTKLVLSTYSKNNKGTYKSFVGSVKKEEVKEEIIKRALQEPKEVPVKAVEYVSVRSSPGFREVFVAGSVFLVLLTFGIKNVHTYAREQTLPDKNAVLSVETEATPPPVPLYESSATGSVSSKVVAVVSVADGSSIDIYEEASASSKIVTKVSSGDVFEVISEDQGWNEIQVNDKKTGYILSKYLEIYQSE